MGLFSAATITYPYSTFPARHFLIVVSRIHEEPAAAITSSATLTTPIQMTTGTRAGGHVTQPCASAAASNVNNPIGPTSRISH